MFEKLEKLAEGLKKIFPISAAKLVDVYLLLGRIQALLIIRTKSQD